MGPHPEEVYWRRRAVAFAVLVVALLLGLWSLTALAGGQEPGAPAPLPHGAAATSTAPTTHDPPAPNRSATPPPAPPTTGQAVPSVAASPPPAPIPPPPGPCPDEVMELTAQPDESEYRVGQRPEFRLIVANAGPVPCFRDLDAALQEVVVLSATGQDRLWSSNDCFTGESDSVRTLAPGERLVFSVVWGGRTSAPGCPAAARETVDAGNYQLVTKLGKLASPPVPFRLR